MAALVLPGAPLSVLLDHGLSEDEVQQMVDGGLSTVEKLGNMTPEQLEELPGMTAEKLDRIIAAVNSYYGQFERAAAPPPASEDEMMAEAHEISEELDAPELTASDRSTLAEGPVSEGEIEAAGEEIAAEEQPLAVEDLADQAMEQDSGEAPEVAMQDENDGLESAGADEPVETDQSDTIKGT
jgi:N utilization substance protein A